MAQEFTVDHISMLIPLVGRLVDIERDGAMVKARIIGVNTEGVHLRVVPKSTKD
jgi:hypothetical protein